MRDKKLLYIAYHYPPIQTSSGVHRTLTFSRCLLEQGWKVSVLTTSLKAYEKWTVAQQQFIPKDIRLIRAFARDTARHFSIGGRYLSWMAVPDRWQSWMVGGVVSGLREIWRRRPDVIVSTYPIATAHIIAYALHKLTGVPWVADFRDPMLQDDYPRQPKLRKAFAWIEKKAVKHCQHIVFTSPGAVELYQRRYPDASSDLWRLVPNGFDSKMFDEVVGKSPESASTDKVTLLHSGTVYPEERDPRPMFQALAELKREQPELAAHLRLVLRATGHDELFTLMLKEYALEDIVELAPGVDYLSALREMLEVDALLLMQASNCNFQTPAKAYEYIRAKRPILALTDPQGDTARVISQSGVALVAPLDDVQAIKQAFSKLLQRIQCHEFNYLSDQEIELFSREQQAKTFSALLDNIGQQ